jgi:hypothetical protein
MGLQEFNYESILKQLDQVLETDISPGIRESIEILQEGLEDNKRMHWIDDDLTSMGLTSSTGIFTLFNINPY